jgi:predicted MFS family arabinose efflux permease
MALPILKWTGHLSFGAVLAVTFAVGCFAAPYMSSSRLIIPEAVGDDERGVAQVNAVIAGANQLTQILGPVLAGVLIAATSPPVVLVVDGATYVFSFLAILLFVRVGKRVEQTEQSRGLLAGLKFLAHDRLLGPVMLAACGINLVAQGLIVAVQGLAYFRYGQDAHVVGYLFAAFGIGALAGAVVAQQLAAKVDLLKLAAIAIVAMPLPLWLMSVSMPWELAMLVLAAFGFFTPLVNAPLFGVLTVRTPAALRPKVITSLITVATLAGPLGFIAAGEALRYVSLTAVFVAIAAGLTVGGVVFATVLLRNRDAPPAPDTSVPAPA